MKDYTAKMLGLEIEIELPRRRHRSPRCSEYTEKIHDYREQKIEQKIKDIAAFGKNVYLHLRKRRYVCEHCGKRFYEENSFLPRYHRMTNRKNAQIIEDFRDMVSAAHIARKHNISPTTAIRYFNMVNYSCKTLPEVLSIDEFKGDVGGEKYQTILTDARNRKILDVLPDRKKMTLIRYFRRFNTRKDVKIVVIDMNPHFREVAEICFPNATIVIDRYHVTRQVVWALERVRKSEQKKLSADWRRFCKHSKAILNKPPEKLKDDEREKLRIILGLSTRLEQAYHLKNDFLFLMHSPNSDVAEELLGQWIYDAENAHLPEFDECTRAIHNWGSLILHAFDCRYTNGFTECCNNKTKVLKRVSFGVRNFHRFRNRILHCAART